jgi:hypothetical protein
MWFLTLSPTSGFHHGTIGKQYVPLPLEVHEVHADLELTVKSGYLVFRMSRKHTQTQIIHQHPVKGSSACGGAGGAAIS